MVIIMGIIEIVLIILGVVVFIGSFLLPAGKGSQAQISEQLNEETIREMVEKEVEGAKVRISDIVDETITYAIEKTERSMDRLTNEKMMAVNEYSDTVLEEINKSHKEVVFLYDMLNDKHENIKTTVSEVDKRVSEVKQTVKDVEILAKEVESSAGEAASSVSTAPAMHTVPTGRVAPTMQPAPVSPPEPVAQESEFKPMEAKKVDVLYRPVESERTEKVIDTVVNEPVHAAASTSVNKTVSEAVNEPAAAPVSEPAGEPAGAAEVEVTLDAAGRNGNRNSNERILELHKKGKSNMAIAKELGLGIGEVKLVIDLFEGQ